VFQKQDICALIEFNYNAALSSPRLWLIDLYLFMFSIFLEKTLLFLLYLPFFFLHRPYFFLVIFISPFVSVLSVSI